MKVFFLLSLLVWYLSNQSVAAPIRKKKIVEGYVVDVIHPPSKGLDFGRCEMCPVTSQLYFFNSFTPDLIEYAVKEQGSWRSLSLLKHATYALRFYETVRTIEIEQGHMALNRNEEIRYEILPFGLKVRLTKEEVRFNYNPLSPWRLAYSHWPITLPYREDRQIIRLFKVKMTIIPMGKQNWQNIVAFHDFEPDEFPPHFMAPFALILETPKDEIKYLGTWYLPRQE